MLSIIGSSENNNNKCWQGFSSYVKSVFIIFCLVPTDDSSVPDFSIITPLFLWVVVICSLTDIPGWISTNYTSIRKIIFFVYIHTFSIVIFFIISMFNSFCSRDCELRANICFIIMAKWWLSAGCLNTIAQPAYFCAFKRKYNCISKNSSYFHILTFCFANFIQSIFNFFNTKSESNLDLGKMTFDSTICTSGWFWILMCFSR